MQPTTESRLLAQIRQDNSTAYAAFCTGHLGMVYDLAQTIARGDTSDLYTELAGEGQVVLCVEAQAFAQHPLSCRFSTYLHTRLKRALVSWRRRQDLVPGTEWQARRAQQARRQCEELTQQLGRAPSADDLCYVYGPAAAASEARYLDVDALALVPAPTEEASADPWASLDRTTRELLGELVEHQVRTGNVSLTQVARRYHVPRARVLGAVEQLAAAL